MQKNSKSEPFQTLFDEGFSHNLRWFTPIWKNIHVKHTISLIIMTAGTITDVIVYTGTMTMMPISHFCSCKTTGSGISGFAPKPYSQVLNRITQSKTKTKMLQCHSAPVHTAPRIPHLIFEIQLSLQHIMNKWTWYWHTRKQTVSLIERKWIPTSGLL